MWREWDPEVVARDFDALVAAGLTTLRVFPLWPDFQPLEPIYGGHGNLREMRLAGQPLPDTPLGRAGVDEIMVERLAALVELAAERDLGLLMPLLTGWMSGRLFVPLALANRNPLTDPLCLQWEVRLVRALVRRLRDAKNILAWELGNECNVMGPVASPLEAWRWVQAITDAIRAADPTRPVLSGLWNPLHGSDPWRPEDLGELCDGVTAHSYPWWMPHVEGRALGEPRVTLHATIAARMQTDLGGKPCLAEEIGSLGPMFGGNQTAAQHVRGNLWNLWAQGTRGCLWWSALDFTRVTGSPYDSHAMEVELGLLDADRRLKPQGAEFRAFRDLLDALASEVPELPPARREAVCVTSPEQDRWAAGLGAFLLAQAAGFDLQFAAWEWPLPEADLYLVPSLSGLQGLPAARWEELRGALDRGATVYVSLEDGVVSAWRELAGAVIERRERGGGSTVLHGEDLPSFTVPPTPAATRYELTPTTARVLARDAQDRPLLTVQEHGPGRLYCLWAGLETACAIAPTADWDAAGAIYRLVAAAVLDRRLVRKPAGYPDLHLTEHPLPDGRTVIVAINNSPRECAVPLALAPAAAGRRLRLLPGSDLAPASLSLPPLGGAVLLLEG
jgi:hypothetical protein